MEKEGEAEEGRHTALMVMTTGAYSFASVCGAMEEPIIGYLWHIDQFLLTPLIV